MKVVGIAGGSGSGKSTVAIALCKKYPEKFALLHIDDYFKRTEEVPKFGGFTNWESPESILFDDLFKDIKSLSEGREIKILTKSELYNPEYNRNLKNKKEVTIYPKEVLLVEGYLAFYDKRIRNLMNYKIYLDIPIEESIKRRSANKFALDKDYFHKVMLPMHKSFVEPTKVFADIVIDTSNKSAGEVLVEVEGLV